jgi:hypothetical protein
MPTAPAEAGLIRFTDPACAFCTRRANQFAPGRLPIFACPAPLAKIFLFFRNANQAYDLLSRSERGALAIVTNVGAGSGGRGSARAQL